MGKMTQFHGDGRQKVNSWSKPHIRQSRRGPRITSSVSKLWQIKAPPRMKLFGWLVVRNNILTHDNLQKRGWTLVSACLLCKLAVEMTQHIFEECNFTFQLYGRLREYRPSDGWPTTPTIEVTDRVKSGTMSQLQKSGIIIMQFIMWRECCARSFSDLCKTVANLMEEVAWYWQFYEQKARGASQGVGMDQDAGNRIVQEEETLTGTRTGTQ